MPREAEKQIDMAAYVLTTDSAVIETLRDASARGEKVRVWRDASGQRVAPNGEIVSGYPFARERARRT